MKITPWKPKSIDPIDSFFDLDTSRWGFPLLPVFDRDAGLGRNSFLPAVDVSEEENQVVVKVDVPGLKKDDISLSAEGSVLTIKGERKLEEEKSKKRYYRYERSYGCFERSFDLGTIIDESKVQAKYVDGVLNITIPKTADAQKKKIQIEN